MQPIYINVGVQGDLLVLPNTQAHLDGHSVLTYSYYLYRNITGEKSAKIEAKESELLLEIKPIRITWEKSSLNCREEFSTTLQVPWLI